MIVIGSKNLSRLFLLLRVHYVGCIVFGSEEERSDGWCCFETSQLKRREGVGLGEWSWERYD